MGSLLQGLQRLYSLDTLDTRLTTSSTTPIRTSLQDSQQQPSPASATRDPTAGKDARAQEIASKAQPSKWNTPEFYFYYFVFITVVPMMFKTVIDVSQADHPSYATYVDLLSPGWIPGRKVDNSDTQYASFRDNIPYLFLLLIIHPLLRRVYNYFNPTTASASSPSKSAAADARLKQRTVFDFNFAILFLIGLHGISIFKILIILFINYKIAKGLPRAYIPAATWIFNLIVLFANELCDGYPLASIARFFVSSEVAAAKTVPTLVAWAEFLDGFGGLMARWQILFKFTILRLISFNMDYYWSLSYPSDSPIEKQTDPASMSERDRLTIPAEPSSYNALYYTAYVLYSPLYLSGPIVTFNDYISQQRYPSPTLTPTRNLLYGIRFCLTLLCMELILHFIYAVAISKSTSDWSIYTPGQLSMLSYFNLNIIWLKLLIPWRFFRLWALLDGVDPPENMVRCMSNNYSALSFWRSWHRSYHLWVVRYLYVPLGGSRSRRSTSPSSSKSTTKTSPPPPPPTSSFMSRARGIFNQLTVFSFVAVWHDINLRLLIWGWLITFFVLPEIIATLLFPASRWRSRPNLYRIICGVGAVGNIIPMMAANLVGFAVGLDGLKGLLAGIFGSWSGMAFMLGACGALFVGVQVMFEIREGEKRKGIKLSC